MHTARDWRYGRLRLRDVAIDLLGTVDHPVCRRARAGILLTQGRRDEAIAELRSLAAAGDQDARRDLGELLRRPRPARELRPLDHVVGGHVRAVTFDPAGSMLATCGADHTVLLWNPLTGAHLRTLRSAGVVSVVAFSPDGTVLATDGGTGQLWNPRTGAHLREPGARSALEGVAFQADGTPVAVGALWTVVGDRVLDIDSGDHVRDVVTMAGAPMSFNGLAFSPDGRFLAVACDRRVELFDPRTGEHVRRVGEAGAEAVAFHPDGALLATARSSRWTTAGVRLWHPATGELVRDLDTVANAVAFSPDGTVLATGDDAGAVVRLRDLT